MTELSDLFAALSSSTGAGLTSRSARVIAVKGRTLTVDLGGGIDIPCVSECNPVPDQWVYILSTGTSMIAVATLGGTYQQATVTVTSNATNTVTGVVNGLSRVVTKSGAFTASVGDVLPLHWSADSSGVWALATPGAAYVPPPAGGGGTSGGGGVTSGTATYPASWGGTYSETRNAWFPGDIFNRGGYFYGASRFRELQGRTITGFRINLVRSAGSGPVSVFGNGQAVPSGIPPHSYSAGSVTPTGWVSLPLGLASYMIGGSGTGAIILEVGVGETLLGLPYGTLQFDWRK